MTHRDRLGFDRKVELSWLDAAAAAAHEPTVSAARQRLYRLLEGAVAGDGPHSGRGKTVTVLARVWISVPPPATAMRTRALRVIEDVSSMERMAVHWSMCCATHPLFVDVAVAVGRLSRLQGEVAQAQVLRRVSESWGERSTLQRAVQRLCRAFVEWGVLAEGAHRGVYVPTPPNEVSPAVSRLLVEGVLVGGGREAWGVEELLSHPALFPFALTVGKHELRGAPEFRVERQGVDIEMVRRAGGEVQL